MTFLLVACLVAGCAGAPLEKSMKLDLVTTTTRERDEILVTASLRNTGSEPVTVLLEPQLSNTYATLTDDRGKMLQARDNRAVQGSRFFQPGKIKTRVLRPGEAVEVEVFALRSSGASAGPMSWELEGVRSKTLTLEMIYEVTEEGARTAKQCQAPDVAVGRWTSKPVTLKRP